MGDFVPDEPQEEASAAPSGVFVPDATSGPAPAQPPAGKFVPDQPSPPPDQPDDPGLLGSLLHGIQAGIGETEESAQAIKGEQPQPPSPKVTQGPEAQPLTWSDALHPLGSGGEKVLYQLGSGTPSLGAGIAGGVAGGLVGGAPGSVVGGALGAAAGSAFQEVGPYFQRQLQAGVDPDTAWQKALEEAGTAGAFSGAGWALFPAKFFSGPLKNLAFQAFGIQPGLQVAGQAAQNIEEGRPVGEDLGQAYGQGVATTAVPMLGHAALRGFREGEIAPAQVNPNQTPIEMGKPLPGAIDFDPIQKKAPGTVVPPNPATGAAGYTVPDDPLRWNPNTTYGKIMNGIADFAKKTLLPESGSEVTRGMLGALRQFIAERASGRDSNYARTQAAYNAGRGMAPEETVELWKYGQGQPTKDPNYQPPAAIAPFMPQFKQWLAQVNKDEADVNLQHGFIQDYLPNLFKAPEQVQQFFQQPRFGPNNTGFMKERTYKLLEDAINAGHELKDANPAELIFQRLNASTDMQAKMRLVYRMNQQGVATPVNNVEREVLARRAGWGLVNDPSGQQWAIHPDLAPMWNNVIASKGLWAKEGLGGDMFRGWMATKNFYVPIKLALSAFHPLHVAHINMNDAFARGWNQLTRDRNPLGALGTVMKGLIRPLPVVGKAFRRGADAAREAWLTPEDARTPEQHETVRYMTEGGFSPQLSEQLRNVFRRNWKDAWANSEYGKAALYGARDAINHMQNALFDKWIPSLKTASYLDEVRTLLARHPELITDEANRKLAFSTIAKSVDNRYGEMFYDNLYWNKVLKDAGIGSFLSLGWNLGFAREFGGGLLEPLLNKLQTQTPTRDVINQVKSKSSFALAYMASAMVLNSVISRQFGGVNYQDMDTMDYLLPRIGGNNPDGSPRRVSNMFYTREIPMLEKHVEDAGGDWLGGMKEMLWNKMMFEPIKEMLQNRDYYGYNIWDENAPYYQQLADKLRFVMSDQFNPITVAGAKRALQAQGLASENDTGASIIAKMIAHPVTNAAAWAAGAGFGPAPTYASRSALVNRINYLYQHYAAPAEKPQIERERMEQMRDARTKLNIAKQQGNPEAVAQAQSNLNELLGTSKRQSKQQQSPDLYMFSRLPVSVQRQLLMGMNKDDFHKYYPVISKAKQRQFQNDPEMRERYLHYLQ